jgi:hypothetical protein
MHGAMKTEFPKLKGTEAGVTQPKAIRNSTDDPRSASAARVSCPGSVFIRYLGFFAAEEVVTGRARMVEVGGK